MALLPGSTCAAYGNITISPYTGTFSNNSNTIYTISAGGGGSAGNGAYYNNSWHTSANPYVTVGTTNSSALKVSGDADIVGNLRVKGVDIGEILSKIQDRLAILVPDPARLEKYTALRQAYEEYKILEALCVDETKPSE